MTEHRKDDDGKAPLYELSTYPDHVLDAEARVLKVGADRYGRHNWKNIDPQHGFERYMSALLRHVHALMLGEELDPDHGYPHTAAIRVNAGFIQYYIDQLAEITVVPGKGIRVGGNPPRANETNHVIGTCGMCKSHIREGNTYIKHNGATFCSKSCHEDWLSP